MSHQIQNKFTIKSEKLSNFLEVKVRSKISNTSSSCLPLLLLVNFNEILKHCQVYTNAQLLNDISGQTFKCSAITNYNSRVIPTIGIFQDLYLSMYQPLAFVQSYTYYLLAFCRDISTIDNFQSYTFYLLIGIFSVSMMLASQFTIVEHFALD